MMMGKFYYSDAFFSYPVIMYFTAGFAGVFSALHHMWKPWCKQGKKKCWFMVCCRECIPAWWGALVKRENLIRVLLNRAEGSVYGHILSFFLPSSEYQPVPISRTEFPFLFYRHDAKKRNPDRHDHMATSTTLGARLSARRGGATPRPASRQPWRRRAATVSHSALGSGIRGTRRQRSVRGQSEVSAGRGFGGGTVTTKELCCPCGQHGLPYKKCCKPYHQASRVADTPRKLLETRFSAYEKGLSQYIVETELATDKDKNSEGRRQDIEASTEKLKFSNLKVSLLLLAVVLAPDLALLLAGAGGGRARRHSCRDTLPLLCAGRGAEGVPRGKARADRGDEPLCQEGWLVALQRRHDRPESKLSSRAAGGRDERETREEAK